MNASVFQEQLDRNQEHCLRRLCRGNGWAMRKSRAQLSLDNHDGFMLVNIDRNWIVAGERFDSQLDDIESYLV